MQPSRSSDATQPPDRFRRPARQCPRPALWATILATIMLSAGCGGSSSDGASPRPAEGFVTLANTIADAPDLLMRAENIDIEGEVDPFVVPFGRATPRVMRGVGQFELTVQVLSPDGGLADLIPAERFRLSANQDLTLIMTGTFANPVLEIIDEVASSPDPGTADVRFLNEATAPARLNST